MAAGIDADRGNDDATDDIGLGREHCPFCPGHESMTPPEIRGYRHGSAPDTPGWDLRVVPNRFPALRVEGTLDPQGEGMLYRVKLPGRSPIVVSGFSLVDEICADKRFDKRVTGAVEKLRAAAGDGLFTAHTQEPNWRKAHNILLSAFSFQSMHTYFPIMAEIAEQLVAKWERMGQNGLDVAADMTRLTLDTIARCGFDYRFDSLSGSEQHPFVTSMVRALREGLEQAQRLWIEDWLAVRKRRRFRRDIGFLFSTVDRVIKERRGKSPSEKPDLLDLMLHGVDKDVALPSFRQSAKAKFPSATIFSTASWSASV